MDILVYTATRGLNTVNDPGAIGYDPKTGITDLSEAINVDISRNSGGGTDIIRRAGFSRIYTGNVHSGFCNFSDCLFIQEYPGTASLFTIDAIGEIQGIRSGLSPNRKMDYCQPPGDDIYYTNGSENGIYANGASRPWVFTKYIGNRTTKHLESPPIGTHLEVCGGYMLVSVGSTLWVSEEFSFGTFNLSDRYIDVADDILMLRCVADGIWVGTANELLFLDGLQPDTWSVKKRISYGVKEFAITQKTISSEMLGLTKTYFRFGEGFLVLTHQGVCWLGPAGQFDNLTWDRIDPTGLTGSIGSAVMLKNRVIFTIEG